MGHGVDIDKDKIIEHLRSTVVHLRDMLNKIDADVERANRKYLIDSEEGRVTFARFLYLLEKRIRKEEREKVEAKVVKRTFVNALNARIESLITVDFADHFSIPVLIKPVDDVIKHERNPMRWRAVCMKYGIKQCKGTTPESAYFMLKEHLVAFLNEKPDEEVLKPGMHEGCVPEYVKAEHFLGERIAGFHIKVRILK